MSTRTKYYATNFEKETIIEGGTTTHREITYIYSPEGLLGLYETTNGTGTMYYVSTDALGSLNLLIKATDGTRAADLGYDAWGRRRNPDTWQYYGMGTEPSLMFDRGYTFHEHLLPFGLINMNGRCYDPLMARMLSPDPFVQAGASTQAYNRYSYALNNPLAFTDPSGYLNVGAGSNPLADHAVDHGGYNDMLNQIYGRGFCWTHSGLTDRFSYTGGVNSVISGGEVTRFGESGAVTYQTIQLKNGECGYYVPHVFASGSYEIMALTFPLIETGRTKNGRLQFIQNTYFINALLPVIGDKGMMDFISIGNIGPSSGEGGKYPGIGIHEESWMSGGITVPPVGIFVKKPAYPGLKEHEYGHYIQYKQMGALSYYKNIALPSLYNVMENWFERKVFGQTVLSVPHWYYRVETDANSRSQSFFGPNSPISSWPSQSQSTPYTWYERLSIYKTILCPTCP